MSTHPPSHRPVTNSPRGSTPGYGTGGFSTGSATEPVAATSDWSDATPNPFSLVLSSAEPSAKSRFLRAAKTLLATLALTLILLSGVLFGKQFLLSRLVSGFDSLEMTAQQNRLVQIASFGNDAIEPLAEKLFADDDAVSETAFTLLQNFQNDWITLPPKAAETVHRRLIAAIANTTRSQDLAAPTSPQLARASALVRQTILEFSTDTFAEQAAKSPSAAAEVPTLLAGANRLLADLDSGLSRSATIVSSGVQSSAQSQSVPISPAGRDAGWTDWPPPSRSQPAQIVRSGEKRLSEDAVESSGLQVLPRGVTAPLNEIASASPSTMQTPMQTSPTPAVLAARPPVGRVLHMTSHLVDSPLEALSDETVVRHLANPDAMLAGRARSELVTRGFSEEQLEMATALAVAGPDDRMRLADVLVNSAAMQSGPWLSMLLDDPDRRVRLHVASTLATTGDPQVLERLRQRLAREEDAHVAFRLRRILKLD